MSQITYQYEIQPSPRFCDAAHDSIRVSVRGL